MTRTRTNGGDIQHTSSVSSKKQLMVPHTHACKSQLHIEYTHPATGLFTCIQEQFHSEQKEAYAITQPLLETEAGFIRVRMCVILQ